MHELKRVGRIVFRGEIPIIPEKPIDYHSWNTFSLDLAKYIQSEPGAIYRIYLSFKPQQSFYPCEEEIDNEYWKKFEEAEEEFFDTPASYYWDDYDFRDFDFYENYDENERFGLVFAKTVVTSGDRTRLLMRTLQWLPVRGQYNISKYKYSTYNISTI